MSGGSCRCGQGWRGLTTCHCSSCHATFSSPSGFDRHQRAGECRDPAAVGLVATPRRGVESLWAFPGEDYSHSDGVEAAS